MQLEFIEQETKRSKLVTSAWMASDHAGCGYYRILLPSLSLCRMGYPAHIMTPDRIQLYNMAQVLIIQRPTDMTISSLIDEAHVNGVKVVFELDDNLWAIPKWNQAYAYWSDMRLKIAEGIMKKCDRVVTTTPYLANFFKKFNEEVMVVPNAVFDHNYIEIPKFVSPIEIVIGWIGSSFHQQDTEIFNVLIPRILDKYPNVGFLMMGEPPPKSLSGYFNRITSLPFVEPIFYHSVLSSFKMHFGLAPLVNNMFNRCKSPVKILEYLYTTSYPICSEIEPYIAMKEENPDSCSLIPTGETQSGTVDDWMDTIDDCLKNFDACVEKAKKGREWILSKYNVESPYMQDIYKKAYFIEE